jgi:hypothetical protein
MHTITVLQYWHITLTAVSVVCVVFGHSRGRKQKTHRKITLLHMGIMLSGVASGIASFFGIQGE